MPAGASPPSHKTQKVPEAKKPRGRKNRGTTPVAEKNGHLTELHQARCHGNGACRSRLLSSATLLRSETFPSAHIGLHQPPTLLGEGRGKINSICAFKKLYPTIAQNRPPCQEFFQKITPLKMPRPYFLHPAHGALPYSGFLVPRRTDFCLRPCKAGEVLL